MWGKRKHKRGWLCHLLPCRTRHRDNTLFKLTVIACLAFPAYILLFNNVSNLGNPGEEAEADLRPGAVRDLAREQTVHLHSVMKATESGAAVRPAPRQAWLQGLMPGDDFQGKNTRGDGAPEERMKLGQESSNSSGQQKVQLIVGTRVLYLGCFKDETERTLRVLREGFIADVRRMTLAMCIRHCYKRGSYYAGLEFHSECYCGKRIYHSMPATQSLCNATCAGNSSETCGGAPYLSIYQLQLDEDRGGEQVRQLDGPGISDTEGLADDFRACVPRPHVLYKQSVFPTGFYTSAPKMTVESCTLTCNERLFPVAALGAGTECHCGRFTRDFRMQKMLSSRECNIPCGGNENYYCGGEATLSVYQTAAEDKRCTNITLMPAGTLPMVAVASFPGSGNTWVRYLIERATGIYTGSFYNDGDLFKKGFIGEKEKWTKGNTIGVKTHRFDEDHVRRFKRAILIIRNPYRSIISEHNRKFGGHVGFAPEMQYTKGTEWIAFVTGKSRTWANTAVNFIQYSKELHVVYYEDLQTRLYDALKEMVQFLNVPVNEERILCVLSSPHGKFKRSGKRKSPMTFDPYTDEMREMVELSLKTVSMALKLRNCTELPNEYNPMLQI